MRRCAAFAAVALAALPASETAAARAPSKLTCANSTGAFGNREERLGPVWVRAVREYADPTAFSARYVNDLGAYWAKAPLSLRRGVSATVSIAPEDRPFARFAFGGRNAGDVVRVTACPRASRRRDRGERRYTTWAGGFVLTQPRCVDVVARATRTRRVYRATLSFGMGDACGRGTGP